MLHARGRRRPAGFQWNASCQASWDTKLVKEQGPNLEPEGLYEDGEGTCFKDWQPRPRGRHKGRTAIRRLEVLMADPQRTTRVPTMEIGPPQVAEIASCSKQELHDQSSPLVDMGQMDTPHGSQASEPIMLPELVILYFPLVVSRNEDNDPHMDPTRYRFHFLYDPLGSEIASAEV